ncbi:MAG TPA: MarR family transcriptional regulator [Opitutaceae bacterium]|nr:MarR family transcriptional regulator [Opitutaceae bacterium]
MSSPAAWSKSDYETLAEFRHALRKFLGFSEEAARQHGVTPKQYQSLLAIEGHPGRNWVTVSELAERLRITHQSAVGLVDRLEVMKLVKRTVSKEDRRCVCLSLTAKGLKLLDKLHRVHREELHVCGPQLAVLLQKAATRIPAKVASTTARPA